MITKTFSTLTESKGDSLLTRKISRLDFIKQIAIVSGALVAGCSPVRILFKAYPRKFDEDGKVVDAVLRAFVTTVIPGAPVDDPNLVRMYTDEYYDFHSFCGFFAADLCQRSADLFGNEHFDQLSVKDRTAVIQDGLNADATLARLYRGAIFIAQVSFYGGVYDDEKGCPLIDYHGANSGFTPEVMYYPNNAQFLAKQITRDGNYN